MQPAVASSETNEATLLPSCPVCTYPLHGLPVHHRCPECGFEFDRRWQVFGGRTTPRDRVHGRRILGATVAGLTLFVLGVMLSGNTLLPILPFISLIVAAQSGYIVWAVLSRPRSFFAEAPEGLLIFKKSNLTDRYDWWEVDGMDCDSLGKTIGLHAAKVDIHLSLREFFGTNAAEAERCAEAISNRAAAKRAAATP